MQAKWYAGKIVHKTKATAEDAAQYLRSKDIKYRLREVKTGWKVDMRIWG